MKIGVIRVTKCSDESAWYRDCVGTDLTFWVMKYDRNQLLWFSPLLYFLPQDVTIVPPQTLTSTPCYTFGLS